MSLSMLLTSEEGIAIARDGECIQIRKGDDLAYADTIVSLQLDRDARDKLRAALDAIDAAESLQVAA